MVKTNQEKAKAYYGAVNRYDLSTIEAMVTEDYIQHNPHVPTGRAAFLALFPKLREHGTQIENLRIFQDGCYVVMHHLWRNAHPFGAKEKVAFHIIRFNQAGLIAEHWSVMTDLKPLNQSGRSLLDGTTLLEDRGETNTNKAKIVELVNVLIETNQDEIEPEISRFFEANYHEHHPQLRDGIKSLLATMRNGQTAPTYKHQHRVFGSGNFVLSVSEGLIGREPVAIYDLFRLKNGLVSEHWSVEQTIPTNNVANQNTMFGF